MKPFTYERVVDAREAGAAVLRANAKFISGGTNLLDLMKLEIEQPAHLVDISQLPLNRLEDLPSGGLRIEAQARNSDVAADPRVRVRYRAVSEALLAGASGQLRNKASIGGSCNVHVARISTIPPQSAISERRMMAARRCLASTGCMRSSAQATPVLRRTLRIWPLHCLHWELKLSCSRRISPLAEWPSTISTAFQAIRRTSKPCCGREK
jgi:CO/xanthine dehydrogenase FAD-binding subunit